MAPRGHRDPSASATGMLGSQSWPPCPERLLFLSSCSHLCCRGSSLGFPTARPEFSIRATPTAPWTAPPPPTVRGPSWEQPWAQGQAPTPLLSPPPLCSWGPQPLPFGAGHSLRPALARGHGEEREQGPEHVVVVELVLLPLTVAGLHLVLLVQEVLASVTESWLVSRAPPPPKAICAAWRGTALSCGGRRPWLECGCGDTRRMGRQTQGQPMSGSSHLRRPWLPLSEQARVSSKHHPRV